jgi:hypothetical protein
MTKKIYYALSSLALFLLASKSFAVVLVDCGGQGQDPCTFTKLEKLVGDVFNFALLNIAVPVAGLIVAYGGILMMVSGGDEGKFKKGKKILTAAAIGLAISFGAWLLVDSIMGFLQLK